MDKSKSNSDSRKGGARRGNTQNDRPAGQQRQNQGQTQNVARENSNNQNRKGGKTGPSAPANNKPVDATATPPSLPASDEHIPLNEFNSTEVDTLLRKAVDPRIPIYKPEAQVPQAKTSSPWGAKRMSIYLSLKY